MNRKITKDMDIYEVYDVICLGNKEAEFIVTEILKSTPDGDKNFEQLMVLDSKNIRGKKLCKLFKYCCNYDIDKLNLTIFALRFNIYNQKEIDKNLSYATPVEFINDDDVDYSYFTPLKRVEFYQKVLLNKEKLMENIKSKQVKKKTLIKK